MRTSYGGSDSYGDWETWYPTSNNIGDLAALDEPPAHSGPAARGYYDQAPELSPISSSGTSYSQEWMASFELDSSSWHAQIPHFGSWQYHGTGSPDLVQHVDMAVPAPFQVWQASSPATSPPYHSVGRSQADGTGESNQHAHLQSALDCQAHVWRQGSRLGDNYATAPAALEGLTVRSSPPRPVRRDPDPRHQGEGPKPQRKNPRHAEDEYTASWIRGDGAEREGWCALCGNWYRLKDSAYWYHMHYTHGISCATGRPFEEPEDFRPAQTTSGFEVLCGSCKQWIYVARRERWTTPYYRHAYKCQAKNKSRSGEYRNQTSGIFPRVSTTNYAIPM